MAMARRATATARPTGRCGPGHALDLLKGGAALFPALVEAIDAARAEVLLETYIFEFAGAPLRVAEALERAAARGVRVRVVVDGIGTGDVPRRVAGALAGGRRALARLQPGARLARAAAAALAPPASQARASSTARSRSAAAST